VKKINCFVYEIKSPNLEEIGQLMAVPIRKSCDEKRYSEDAKTIYEFIDKHIPSPTLQELKKLLYGN